MDQEQRKSEEGEERESMKRVTLKDLRAAFQRREAAWKFRHQKLSTQQKADLQAERSLADGEWRELAMNYALQRLKVQ